MFSPYIERDPTALCSYEDCLLTVETITDFCLLRAESVRRQLNGTIPSALRGQAEAQSSFVDATSVWLPDMGKIADMKELHTNRMMPQPPVCGRGSALFYGLS